jgi:hypothetical protein
MDFACIVLIVESISARCDEMENNLGHPRCLRLLSHAARGCRPIEAVLLNWVDGVAREQTRNPETLQAVKILLAIFIEECRALQTLNWSTLRRFRYVWVRRCVQRLEMDWPYGMLSRRGSLGGDLVFLHQGSTTSLPDAQNLPY